MSQCHPGELKKLEHRLGGLLVSTASPMFCEKSVKTGPISTSKTREQANSKGAKGITKINFPI